MAKTSLPIRKKVYAMKIDAGNDNYGNPRRGWMIYDGEGYYLGFVDEGYSGRHALTQVAPKAVELGNIPTTPGTYRELNKDDLGLALIRKGTKKRKSKSRKSRSKARSKLRKGKSRKAKSRKASSRKRVSAKARKAKSRAKSRNKGRSKARSRAKKTKRVKTTGGYRYMVNGKFVKKAVYDRAVGSKRKSRSKSRSKAKSRAKGRSRKNPADIKSFWSGNRQVFMVGGKFVTQEAYDKALKKARKTKRRR